MNGDLRNKHTMRLDYIVKDILRKKLHQDRWIRFWTFHSESLLRLTCQSVN